MIPFFYMPTIPSRAKEPEKHARLVTMLLKPFRELSDLRPIELSWIQVLEDLELSISPEGTQPNARLFRILQNAEAIGARADAHQSDLDRRRRAKTATGYDPVNSAFSGSLSDDEADAAGAEEDSAYAEQDCKSALANDTLTFHPLKDDGFMSSAVSDASLGYRTLAVPKLPRDENSVQTISASIRDASKQWKLEVATQRDEMTKRLEANQVRKVSDFPDAPEQPPRAEARSFAAASIADFISSMPSEQRFNKEQAHAFTIVAQRLMDEMVFEKSPQSIAKPEQLLMFLSGEAGTGKTYVVEQLAKFLEQRGCPGWMQCFAFTGSAAVAIRGRTLHSALGLGFCDEMGVVRKGRSSREPLKRMLTNLRLLVVDEVSMIEPSMLGQLSTILQQVQHPNNQDAHFGKLHVLFLGDFSQLNPVGRKSLYQLSAGGKGQSISSVHGRNMWELVNIVVRLERNQRCADQAYLSMLRGVRMGQPTAEHEALLRSRMQSSLMAERSEKLAEGNLIAVSAIDAQLAKFGQLECPTVVGMCEIRAGVAVERLLQAAERTKQHLFIARSHDLRQANGTRLALPARLQSRLWRIKDSLLRYSLGKLPLLPGAWYVVTENSAFAPELGIAKGSQLRLERILLDPEEPGYDATSTTVNLQRAPTLIMHHPNSRLLRPLKGMPDVHTIPVTAVSISAAVPMSLLFGRKISSAAAKSMDSSNEELKDSMKFAKTYCTKCKVKRKPKGARLCLDCKADVHGKKASGPTWTIVREQFPLRPACSHTAHTVQGMTFRAGGAIDLNSQSSPSNFAYVLLSRVTKTEDLLILRDFNFRVLRRKPNAELLQEEARLQDLADSTAARFAALFKEHCHMYEQEENKLEQKIESKQSSLVSD